MPIQSQAGLGGRGRGASAARSIYPYASQPDEIDHKRSCGYSLLLCRHPVGESLDGELGPADGAE